MAQLIAFSNITAQPWKNGGGSTTEIAIGPQGAGFNDFDWRISVATVASDGPFSLFAGIDRTLVLLQGAGMDLQTDDGRIRALRPDAPDWVFPGEWPVMARLCNGVTVDFNVMTRRSRYRHQVRHHSLPHHPLQNTGGGSNGGSSGGSNQPGQTIQLTRQLPLTLFFVAAINDNESCQLGEHQLRRFDSLLLDANDDAALMLQSSATLSLLQVELAPLAAGLQSKE
ncbi:MAG: hypothetical protein RL748_105 [Pseudomonadota bacterium]|jgi:environmental stress-induced protein Ves